MTESSTVNDVFTRLYQSGQQQAQSNTKLRKIQSYKDLRNSMLTGRPLINAVSKKLAQKRLMQQQGVFEDPSQLQFLSRFHEQYNQIQSTERLNSNKAMKLHINLSTERIHEIQVQNKRKTSIQSNEAESVRTPRTQMHSTSQNSMSPASEMLRGVSSSNAEISPMSKPRSKNIYRINKAFDVNNATLQHRSLTEINQFEVEEEEEYDIVQRGKMWIAQRQQKLKDAARQQNRQNKQQCPFKPTIKKYRSSNTSLQNSVTDKGTMSYKYIHTSLPSSPSRPSTKSTNSQKKASNSTGKFTLSTKMRVPAPNTTVSPTHYTKTSGNAAFVHESDQTPNYKALSPHKQNVGFSQGCNFQHLIDQINARLTTEERAEKFKTTRTKRRRVTRKIKNQVIIHNKYD